MNSYLQTLKQLQNEHSNSQLIQEASKYNNYQEYLHRSKLRQSGSQKYLNKEIKTPKNYEFAQSNAEFKNKSQTVFYPVQRKEIQYHGRQYVQRIPKKKKVVEYVERKEVKMIPKQITKTSYYAVQHLKSYKMQTVPEVRIETIQVPKTVKNVQYVPKEKQTIYYPSHLTDMREIKERARIQLEKQGVIIKQDAQFKPLNAKMNIEQVNRLSENLKMQIQQAQQKLKRLQQNEKEQTNRIVDKPYYHLARPNNQKKELRANFSKVSEKHISWDDVPIGIQRRKQNQMHKNILQRHNVSNSSYQYGIDSSFAEKDLYRYNLLVNSSIKPKY